MKTIDLLHEQPFMAELIKHTDGIYLVGGIVRDFFLEKESKDIDLLVTKLEVETIVSILAPFGYIGVEGESFAVIKFKPHGMELVEPIDIAIPRRDIKIGDGHKGFEIVSDPFMAVETDMGRRDITINSFAMSVFDKTIVDPFGGMDDLKAGLIRATTATAFVEDPLRMLRVVQFAARFDFEIEAATLVAIQQHAHLIKTITAERIVTELDKIYYKGSKQKGLSILVETGLFEQIFGQVYVASFLMPIFLDKDITRADFYFILMQFMATPDVFFAKTLKGDTTTTKAIAAIVVVRDGLKEAITKHQKRFLTLDAIRKSKLVLESYIVSHLHGYEEVVREFKSGQMPCGETDLAITGDMMITEKGYVQGKALGDKRKELLGAVITDKCQNTPEGLFALC